MKSFWINREPRLPLGPPDSRTSTCFTIQRFGSHTIHPCSSQWPIFLWLSFPFGNYAQFDVSTKTLEWVGSPHSCPCCQLGCSHHLVSCLCNWNVNPLTADTFVCLGTARNRQFLCREICTMIRSCVQHAGRGRGWGCLLVTRVYAFQFSKHLALS